MYDDCIYSWYVPIYRVTFTIYCQLRAKGFLTSNVHINSADLIIIVWLYSLNIIFQNGFLCLNIKIIIIVAMKRFQIFIWFYVMTTEIEHIQCLPVCSTISYFCYPTFKLIIEWSKKSPHVLLFFIAKQADFQTFWFTYVWTP